MKKGDYVLVTTIHRGVFAGVFQKEYEDGSIELTEARNCIKWSNAMKGVFGLAVVGPDNGCRIGRAVPELTIRDVTSVGVCTRDAKLAWEQEPW